jgi:hypothetical protein
VTYVTAQLLQGMHGYCSGNERLFELSDSNRSALVQHAKCMGLFQDPVPHASSSGDSEEAWKEWVRQERSIRLGWAVMVSLMHLAKRHLIRFRMQRANLDSRSMTFAKHRCRIAGSISTCWTPV